MAVPGQVERVGQQSPGLLVVGVGGGELFPNARQLTSDADLLDLEQVERDSPGVVGVEELLTLGHQLDALLLHLLTLARRCLLESVEVFQNKVFDVVPQFGGQRDGAVLLLDQLFDDLDRHGLPIALGDPAGAAGTDQVGVLGAPSIPSGGDHEPRSAAAAVNASSQVVLVGPLVGPGGVVGGEDVLDLLPGLGIDQRFVQAGIGDTSVMDFTFVVGVPEQIVQTRHRERFAGPLWRGPSGQPTVGELIEQNPERGVAFGVAVEGPRDEVRSSRIDLDRPVDAPQLVSDVDVAVPEQGSGDGATEAGLLDQPLGDLVGKVAGVELGDAAHDPVHEHPRRGFVNVLAGADQRHPRLLECEVDADIVGSGPRQPVELVDDAVIHRVFTDIGEHALQLGALGSRRAGLPGIDELLDDDRVE